MCCNGSTEVLMLLLLILVLTTNDWLIWFILLFEISVLIFINDDVISFLFIVDTVVGWAIYLLFEELIIIGWIIVLDDISFNDSNGFAVTFNSWFGVFTKFTIIGADVDVIVVILFFDISVVTTVTKTNATNESNVTNATNATKTVK